MRVFFQSWRSTLLLLLPLMRLAQPLAAIAEWSEIESELKLSSTSYLQPIKQLPSWQGRARLDSKVDYSYESFQTRIHPNWIYDTRKLHRLEFQELWLKWSTSQLEVGAGAIQENWAVTDWLSPLDIWNRADLVDPIAPSRLPHRILKLTLLPTFFRSLSLDFVFSPFTDLSVLPIDIGTDPNRSEQFKITDSRWLMGLPTRIESANSMVLPVEYEITGVSKNRLNQYGLRGRLMSIQGMDFSLVYGKTTSAVPAFDVTTRGSLASPSLPVIATLRPSLYEIETIGIGFETTLGDYGIRAELAQKKNSGFAAKNPNSIVTGDLVEKEKYFFVLGADHLAGIKVAEHEVYGGITFAQVWPPKAARPLEASQNFDPWEQNLGFSLFARSKSGHQYGFSLLEGLAQKDRWIHPYASLSLYEGLEATVSADLFSGRTTGFWGQFRDNDRWKAEIKYLF